MSNLNPSPFSGKDTDSEPLFHAKVNIANKLVPFVHDYISYTSGSTTDTYVYKSGGSGGTTVATVTVTWTDSTKTVLSTVVRT